MKDFKKALVGLSIAVLAYAIIELICILVKINSQDIKILIGWWCCMAYYSGRKMID